MRQPTTIPQYKQFCKALKLKILKQKTTIQSQSQDLDRLNGELKQLKKSSSMLQPRRQNNENSMLGGSALGVTDHTKISQNNTDTESFQGRLNVMNKFKYGVCSFGVTPEAVFRIADVGYKGEVQADFFRQVLAKIQLGLTPRQISCLIYIFDENCTGFITRDDYNDSLNAYRLSLEESYLHYTATCVEKLARLFEVERIQVLKYFQDMEGRIVNSVDLNRFAEKIRSSFGKRLQNREIMGAFSAIDLENDGIVCKKNFVYSLTSAMNKLMNSAKKSNSFDQHQTSFNKSNANLSNKKPNPSTLDNINTTTNMHQSQLKPPKQQPVDQQLLTRLQSNHKVTLHQVYEQICRFPIKKRLTLMQFKKIMNQLEANPKVSGQLSSQLFKAIDCGHKGTLYFNQLINYYLAYESDMAIVFHLVCKYFLINDLNPERFWFLYGVSSDSDITKAKFLEIMGKSFGLGGASGNETAVWEKLWAYFDKGRGIVSVSNINKELNKYDSSE